MVALVGVFGAGKIGGWAGSAVSALKPAGTAEQQRAEGGPEHCGQLRARVYFVNKLQFGYARIVVTAD